MVRTWEDPPLIDAVGHTDDVCPVCTSSRVRVHEGGWFVLELDRDLVRDDPAPEFTCLDCRSLWW